MKNRKTEIRKQDEKRKQQMKYYADKRNNAKQSHLKEGDKVIVKQKKHNKLSTPYEIEPLEIIAKKGSMITATNNNKTVTRNSSSFKEVKPTEPITDDVEINKAEPNTQDVKSSDDLSSQPQPTPRYNLRQHINRPKYLDDYVAK